MRVAVIDLGTNTFHLLIVEADGHGNFKEVYRERRFVHLAEDGIHTIGKTPFNRAIKTMNAFAIKIIEHQAQKVKAKGTAALRRASNGAALKAAIKSKTGIEIETISGADEARLIYVGVREAVTMYDLPMLIMDIGGGSVELIIANKDKIFYAESFPIGVAVLYERFHKSEPISQQEMATMQTFLAETLAPLTNVMQQHNIKSIIGSSGTFDVLERILPSFKPSKFSAHIEFATLRPFYEAVINATLKERLAMPKVPKHRAQLMVVAILLLNFVIEQYNIQDLIISNFAMKEGMIREALNEL